MKKDSAIGCRSQVARKLAHLYNEEARAALLQRSGGEKAEELLQQAQHWMAGGLRCAQLMPLYISPFGKNPSNFVSRIASFFPKKYLRSC